MSSKSKQNSKRNKNTKSAKANTGKQKKNKQKALGNKSKKQKQKTKVKKASNTAKKKKNTKQNKPINKSVKRNPKQSNNKKSVKKKEKSKSVKKPKQSNKKKKPIKKTETKQSQKKPKAKKQQMIKKKVAKQSNKPKAVKHKPKNAKKKQNISKSKPKSKSIVKTDKKKKSKTESVKHKNSKKAPNKPKVVSSKKSKTNVAKKQKIKKSANVKTAQTPKSEKKLKGNTPKSHRQKDIEIAKNRLHKRVNKETVNEKPKKTVRKQAKIEASQPTFDDKTLWNDYISKFGNEPSNASQLQQFSKVSNEYTALPYKEANTIFEKYSNKKKGKTETKKERKKVYIKRDIDTAKKRLSLRLNQKELNFALFNVQKTDTLEERRESPLQNEIMTELNVIDATQEESDSDISEVKEMEMGTDITDEYDHLDIDGGKESSESIESELETEASSDEISESNHSGSEEVKEESDYEIEEIKEMTPPPLPSKPPKKRTLPPKLPSRPKNGETKTVSHSVITSDTRKENVASIVELETFLESERVYVKEGLRIGYETFLNRLEIYNRLNESILSAQDIQAIFGNYASLYNCNKKLFGDLMEIRLNGGITAVRDNLGQIMVNFIPYFRMYADYIVRKHRAVTRLDVLKKSNKKFKQFLKINETCIKRKLKSFLEEPVYRIPQYLQFLGKIYASYKMENNSNNKAQQLLLQSIIDIKKMSDEIAIKCRDLKARALVGTLQRDVFGDKINLLSAHRFCITHISVDMLLHNYKEKKIKTYKFILCNDIFLISTLKQKFKSANLIYVFPLVGLRISRNPVPNSDNRKLLERYEYMLSLLPSNNIMFCEDPIQMEKMIEMIEEAVDEQEHSLKQCNIIDLEKRLRKQKTSKEGKSDTITITNPERIRQIELWHNEKYSDEICIPETQTGTETEQRIPPSLPKRNTNNASKPPPLPKRKTSDAVSSVKNTQTNDECRIASKPPPLPKRKTFEREQKNKPPPLPERKVSEVAMSPQIRRKTIDITPAPSVNVNGQKDINETETNPAPNPMRMNLLSGITSFKKSGQLKHINAETLKQRAVSEPQNVTNLLQSTLKTYRQFVMDEDDEESESDAEWSD